MISPGIWFMSFLVYGLIIQDLKGQEDAEHSTSSWNQNQHRYRPTNEPRLQAFDQVNTRDDSEELEPVTNPRRVVINKVVPGQEMHRDVLNSGYVVSDGRTVSQKHKPMKQTQKWTKIEPRQEVLDRIHTTNVHEEFESVTNIQPKNQIRTELQQDQFDRIITTEDSEEFEPVTKALSQNPIRIEPQQEVFDRTVTTDGSEEFEPVTINQPQNPTTTEPQLRVFDRMNTTDDSDEVEPVTNIEPQNTEKAPLRVPDKIHATDDSVRDYNGTVINKPVHQQDMYSDIMAQAVRNMIKTDSRRSQKSASVREQSHVRKYTHQYSKYFDQQRKRHKRPSTVTILSHKKKQGNQLTQATHSRKRVEHKIPLRK